MEKYGFLEKLKARWKKGGEERHEAGGVMDVLIKDF
jgi:hypothetical protein